MATVVKKTVSKKNSKTYVSKDFDSLRSDLVTYARNYFSDQIKDFSEPSLGGMFVELAAYVGDTLNYYLDHQFNELNPSTAIETKNIENHAKNAGIKVAGAAASIAVVTFYIEVPALVDSAGEYTPDTSTFPIIKAETELNSSSGIKFTLFDDLDFNERNSDNQLTCDYTVSAQDSSGNPSAYIIYKDAECVSGAIRTDTYTIANALVPFRKITLSRSDVTEILKVKDSENNEYYEVESLAQDTVFKKIKNSDNDKDLVSANMEIISAPRRYVRSVNFTNRLTTIQFGSGDASSTDDDIIADPSDLALPLYGKKTFSKFSIDPNSLLKTQTLGVSPINTVISVQYRYGGGINHNVSSDSIRSITSLQIMFPQAPTDTVQNSIIKSLDIKNASPASGGANAMSLEDLKRLIPAARNQQMRIVTVQDLLSRVYTLPPSFGRVYRAGIRKNPENPLTTELYLICQDMNKNLVLAPDALKKNMRTYLNEFRMISDAIDILDSTVVNYAINFSIVCTPGSNKGTVLANAISAIKNVTNIKYYQIDQPLIEADVINAIINTEGVLSLVSLSLDNRSGTFENREYSDYEFDIASNLYKGLVIGPPGGIFELKYPDSDIIGSAE